MIGNNDANRFSGIDQIKNRAYLSIWKYRRRQGDLDPILIKRNAAISGSNWAEAFGLI